MEFVKLCYEGRVLFINLNSIMGVSIELKKCNDKKELCVEYLDEEELTIYERVVKHDRLMDIHVGFVSDDLQKNNYNNVDDILDKLEKDLDADDVEIPDLPVPNFDYDDEPDFTPDFT